MNFSAFTARARAGLLVLAVFGFIGPNGLFLWYVFTDFAAVQTAQADPVARLFMVEAAILMGLLAWLVHRSSARPGWLAFIFMSLIGSLAFSVPAWLWLASRNDSASR